MTDETDDSRTDEPQTNDPEIATRLERHAIPLETTDRATDRTDLEPIGDLLADAGLVGLGEATHGTRDVFRLKHRLLRHLVVDHGYRLFGLEANFSETLALDAYVVDGEGSPREALAATRFWIWNVEAVLALVEWLRSFNEGRPREDRVRFYGFDAQFTAGPAGSLDSFLAAADRVLHETVADDVALLDDWPEDDETRDERLAAADRVVATLEERFDAHEADDAGAGHEAWGLARRHLETLARARDLQRAQADDDTERGMRIRDRAMADTVAWMLDREGTDRAVLWAHNGHVNRASNRSRSDGSTAPSMGYHLAERYGENYYAVGFDFGRGSFQALTETDDGYDLGERSLGDPPAGSFAAAMTATDEPLSFLDLRSVDDEVLAAWLREPRRLRSVGAIHYGPDATDRHHDEFILADAYDGLLFVGETTRAIPLERD